MHNLWCYAKKNSEGNWVASTTFGRLTRASGGGVVAGVAELLLSTDEQDRLLGQQLGVSL